MEARAEPRDGPLPFPTLRVSAAGCLDSRRFLAKAWTAAIPSGAGVDGAGIVAAKGARVRGLRLGDRVYAYEFGNRQGGFYAEFAAVAAKHVGRVPKNLTLREAGAVATMALTALQGIDALELRPGQAVLIFGASGAVGTMALQFGAGSPRDPSTPSRIRVNSRS